MNLRTDLLVEWTSSGKQCSSRNDSGGGREQYYQEQGQEQRGNDYGASRQSTAGGYFRVNH